MLKRPPSSLADAARAARIDAVSLHPTAGAHGELTALMVTHSMRDALDALTMILQNRDVAPTYSAGADRTHATRIIDDDAQLSQETLWDKLSEGLTSGNIVLADQGTSFYGMAAHRLPTGEVAVLLWHRLRLPR